MRKTLLTAIGTLTVAALAMPTAAFADDTALVWTAINVCDNSYVTVKVNASGTPTFTAN